MEEELSGEKRGVCDKVYIAQLAGGAEQKLSGVYCELLLVQPLSLSCLLVFFSGQ